VVDSLEKTGERQVASKFSDIRADHRNRYIWVRDKLDCNDKVIDAGCGVGYGSRILLESCSFVSSFDISQSAIDYANRYWKGPNSFFKQGDLHLIEFETCSSDKMVAFEVLEHLAFPELFIQHAYKGLKEGGLLYVSVPNEDEIEHSISLNPFHFKHYRLNEVVELFERNGFRLKTQMYQDYEELFSDKPGKFILLELEKISKKDDSQFVPNFEASLSFLTSEIHSRSESIANLKKELELKYKQSESRAELIRGLQKKLDSEKIKNEIANARLDTFENASNSIFQQSGNQTKDLIREFSDRLNIKDKEILRLTAELAKAQATAAQLLVTKDADVDALLEREKYKFEQEILSCKRESEHRVSNHIERCSSLEAELILKKSELENKQSEIEIYQAKIRNGNEELESLRFLNDYWQQEIKANGHLVVEKNKRILQAEDNVKKLASSNESLRKSLIQLQSEISEIANKYQISLRKVESYLNAENYLKAKIERLVKSSENARVKESKLLENADKQKSRADNLEEQHALKLELMHLKLQENSKKLPLILTQCLTHKTLINTDSSFVNAVSSYLKELRLKRLIRSSALFDGDWYTNRYNDIEKSGLSPELHFLRIGSALGRNPSVYFDVRRYFRDNKDLDSFSVNPVVHFELFGRFEGREVFPLVP